MKKTQESKQMIKHLKATLIDYMHSLTMYDYVAFGWLLFLLLLLILLALVTAKKKPTFASFLVFFTFILMFIAPIGIKLFLDKTVRKVEVLDQNSTYLQFSKALVVTGNIKNLGKIDLRRCYIQTKILKQSDNKYLDLLYNIKPLRQRTIVLDKNITQKDTNEFKVVFEKFNNSKKYKLAINAECY